MAICETPSKKRKVQLGLGSFFKGEALKIVSPWHLSNSTPRRGKPSPAQQAKAEEEVNWQLRCQELQEKLSMLSEEHEKGISEVVCLRKGVKGGRPLESTLRGVRGGQRSNCKLVSEAAKKVELSASVKSRICLDMEATRANYETETSWHAAMAQKLGRPRKQLAAMWAKRDEWKSLVEKDKLSLARYAKPSLGVSRGEHKLSQGLKQRVRAEGAGMKRKLQELEAELKSWAWAERSYGHSLSKKALVRRYSVKGFQFLGPSTSF